MAEYTPVSKVNYDLFKQNYDPNLPYNKQSQTILQKYNEDLFNKYSGIASEEPKLGFFDKLGSGLENLFSAYGAEMPQVPNLSYQNITPTFDLGTGITNTSAATNMYTPFMSNQEMVNRDLVDELIQKNQQKIASDFIDVQGDITDVDLPYSGIGSMRYSTPRTIADQNRVLGQTFTEEEPSGIKSLLQKAIRFAMPGLSFLENIAGGGQPYEQFTKGGTIKNGIYSIDGVNVPVSSFGGDFYNPNTGLNRFDRARNRFNETRSLKDLFGASRTLAEFNNARKILEAQKKSGYKSDFMNRPKSERNYTGPSGGDNTGGDIGAKTAADSFSNKSGMGRTGY